MVHHSFDPDSYEQHPEEHGATPASSNRGISLVVRPVESVRVRAFTPEESAAMDAAFVDLDLDIDSF